MFFELLVCVLPTTFYEWAVSDDVVLLPSPGAAEDMAHSSLRFGIGRFTTEAEIDFVVQHIVRTVHKLREMRSVFLQYLCAFNSYPLHSPLWEMVQEGIDINSIDWSQH